MTEHEIAMHMLKGGMKAVAEMNTNVARLSASLAAIEKQIDTANKLLTGEMKINPDTIN